MPGPTSTPDHQNHKSIPSDHSLLPVSTIFTLLVKNFAFLSPLILHVAHSNNRCSPSRLTFIFTFLFLLLFLRCLLRYRGGRGTIRVQIPIDLAVLAMASTQPIIGLAEVSAVEETSGSTKRARVDAFQDEVFFPVDFGDAIAGRLTPGEKHDAVAAFLRDQVDDLLGKGLPAAFLV